MSNELKINWYYKLYFWIISLLCQIYLLIIFYILKYRFLPVKFMVKMTEFIARYLDGHIDWAQKKKFWTGTQQIHRNFFLNFIKRKIPNRKYGYSTNGDEWNKLIAYYYYVLGQYEDHLMIHKYEFSSKVLFEKVVTKQ